MQHVGHTELQDLSRSSHGSAALARSTPPQIVCGGAASVAVLVIFRKNCQNLNRMTDCQRALWPLGAAPALSLSRTPCCTGRSTNSDSSHRPTDRQERKIRLRALWLLGAAPALSLSRTPCHIGRRTNRQATHRPTKLRTSPYSPGAHTSAPPSRPLSPPRA